MLYAPFFINTLRKRHLVFKGQMDSTEETTYLRVQHWEATSVFYLWIKENSTEHSWMYILLNILCMYFLHFKICFGSTQYFEQRLNHNNGWKKVIPETLIVSLNCAEVMKKLLKHNTEDTTIFSSVPSIFHKIPMDEF